MLTEMVGMQGASAKLILASRSQLCQHTVVFRRRISFIAAGRKQTSCKDFPSVCSEYCCSHLQLASSRIKYRRKSYTSINAPDHFVELGVPQLEDDVNRLAANISTRNMNIDISDLVWLFLQLGFLYFSNNKRLFIALCHLCGLQR